MSDFPDFLRQEAEAFLRRKAKELGDMYEGDLRLVIDGDGNAQLQKFERGVGATEADAWKTTEEYQ
jgi:hypothetical protein